MDKFIEWYVLYWNSFESIRRDILVALVPAVIVWYLTSTHKDKKDK